MKYAPWFLLLIATSAQANGWEWKRPPVTAQDYAEIKRIAQLTPLSKCELDAVMESERCTQNQQVLMQYNRMLPSPMPLVPTPCVPPPARRGIHRLIH